MVTIWSIERLMRMAKRKIQLTLIIDTNENPTIEEIRRDLEREINCASYFYEVIDTKEIVE